MTASYLSLPALCLSLLLTGTGLAADAKVEEIPVADLILHHGRIITVDETFRIAEALAVNGDRILAAGTEAEILKFAGAQTAKVDLKGKTVLPGLIDSHTHPWAAAMTEFDHPIPAMETIADVLDYLRARAQVLPDGEWIVLQQVFITRLKEQRYPTRAELDLAAPKHPVVFRTGPDASMNSLALEHAGIDRDFVIPGGLAGRIEKTADGEPNGILRNFSNYITIPPQTARRAVTENDREDRFKLLMRDYHSVGITSICDRNANPSDLELYKKLRDKKELAVRVSISHRLNTLGALEEIERNLARIAADPLFREKDSLLRIIGVKSFLDGGMLTGSAYMREPWGVSDIYAITDPDYRGVLFIPRERLLPIVRKAVELGLQFTAHSVGDGAVHALLEVYAEINLERPIRETRPGLTHSNFMSREAVEEAARLGVVVDIQPAWLYLDARTLARQFGYDRLRYFQPLRTLFESGAVAGGGSDHMQKIGARRAINPYDPFLGMWITLTRRAQWYEGRLHPEEALTREQAIRFYTINNAFLTFAEHEKGSLEPGKLADFIVLDRDILECPVDEVREIQVERTYLGGKLVYKK
jgi:predicted amidohydrolase YtcJ